MPRSKTSPRDLSKGLPFGAPSRGAREIATLCRRAILDYVLPASMGLLLVYVAIFTYKGLPFTPMAAFLATVLGLSFAARRYRAYAAGAATFVVGTFVCLMIYSVGLGGDPNGLASGASYTLCAFPLFAWVCATRRWQRLVSLAIVLVGLVVIYAVGQPPTQGFIIPDNLMALALGRCFFLTAVLIGIAYGFDRSIDSSHARLEEALSVQRDLNFTLDERASELRDSQARYRHLFENAFDGIVLFDSERDEPIEINQTLAKRLGYTPEELLGLHPAEVSPALQRDGRPTTEVRAEVTAMIDAQASCRYPWRHRTAGGELVDFEIHTFTVNEDRSTRVSMLRDVTEQLRAEAALQEANRELRGFSHAASHDLKEPLRTMSNFARLLQRRYADRLDEAGLEYLNFIMDAGQRGTTLVNDLLRYAEAGTDEVELESVDLSRAADQVRRTVEARLSEEGARLDVGDLPTVTATATWAQQLLQNLVSNALKFKRTGVPPVVTVTARETADHHHVDVRDNGIGIAEEDLQRVFGIFERLVLRDQYEGSGIGLALCRRIMDRVGGRIRVTSVLGEGTTFTLTFPKAAVGEGVGAVY